MTERSSNEAGGSEEPRKDDDGSPGIRWIPQSWKMELLIEQAIYDWVYDEFGQSEAEMPSWNIRALASYLARAIYEGHAAQHDIYYERG